MTEESLEEHTETAKRMYLWDRKLDRLDDEMLIYVKQRAYLILESREAIKE